LTREQRIDYARAVWQAFEDKRGQEQQPSSAEWHVLAGWMDLDIPLRVVLRAMADTGGRAKRLDYYAGPVREAYKRWLEAVA
jgi:hypothetical protein